MIWTVCLSNVYNFWGNKGKCLDFWFIKYLGLYKSYTDINPMPNWLQQKINQKGENLYLN